MAVPQDVPPEIEAIWREMLTHGHHTRLAFLPGSRRCTVCRIPVAGVGGAVLKPFGRGPSRKSPNLCNLWEVALPPGGAEIDIAVLFADVRGSTALGESMGASAFAMLLNRFYKAATKGLLAHDAMIDKMIGDEVMALFIPGFSGSEYRRAPVRAAEDIMRAVGYGGNEKPWLPLGIGIHAGPAFVGRVGTEEINDFTALGDTVNTAARLQAEAKPGEIVLSEAAYQEIADRYPDLEQKTIKLRGKQGTIAIRVIQPSMLQAA